MTEHEIRAVVAAHGELVQRAITLVRKYGPAISTSRYAGPSDFSPADEDGIALTIDGDVASLHFTTDDYDAYASSYSFDARALWSRKAIALGIKRRREAEREAAIQRLAQGRERERQQYEYLRRRFEPANPSDLRADIRSAIGIHERIVAEDQP